VIRLCVLNHTTRAEDVERTLDFLESAEVPHEEMPAPAQPTRDSDVSESWARGPSDDGGIELAELFQGLSGDELRRVRASGQQRRAVSGETLIAQWALSRELFVVLDGEAEVLVDGELCAELRRGDVFGELGALDWGSGYGYSRTATVRATSNMELLVVPADELQRLLRELPVVETRIRAALRQHLT
jgi:hypothetical protein